MPISPSMHRALEETGTAYLQVLTGRQPLACGGEDAVRAHLKRLVEVITLARPSPTELGPLERERDQALRLWHWSEIRARFQLEHADLIHGGFRCLGLEPPDFGALSRRDALL